MMKHSEGKGTNPWKAPGILCSFQDKREFLPVKANEQKKKANISYNSEICSIGENRGNFVKREPQIQSNFHSDV